VPLGIRVALLSDDFGHAALAAGLAACGLHDQVPLLSFPPRAWDGFEQRDWPAFVRDFKMTHLVALERPGPSHTLATLREQGITSETHPAITDALPPQHQDRYHTMAGRDITDMMSPAHRLFEAPPPGVVTLGIGDGGNEIGMGKLPWDVIARNIPGGARVACRSATDHLIVAGVSNWGAYALATGVRLLRGGTFPPADLYDVTREEQLLSLMVERGPLVDGVTAKGTATVDGLSFAMYARKLQELGACNRPSCGP
jgi:hypothetical protein